MASWTVLEEVVIRVETFPGETVSTALTGCAKVARRYASLRAAEILSPLIRMVIWMGKLGKDPPHR